MAELLIVVTALSGVCAFLVGRAFVAPRDSFLRTQVGGFVAGGCVIFALFVPPTIAGLAGGANPLAAAASHSDIAILRGVWVALTSAGLLSGMRVWRLIARLRGGGGLTLDESPVSRAESQLLLADSLQDALDVLGRENVSPRDVVRLSERIRHIGLRYWNQVPEKQGDAYRLVAAHVPAQVAAAVTGLLLEGSGRR